MAKHLVEIRIKPAENGGHTVEHHVREMAKDNKSHSGVSMAYYEPEQHVFGKDEGHEMIAHVANHLGIKAGEGDAEEDNEDEK